MLKKKLKEKPIRLSGYLEEKHTISPMCNECQNKCPSHIRIKKYKICQKVYNARQQQNDSHKIRIIKEVFDGIVPASEIMENIDDYIAYAGDAIDKLSFGELKCDYEEFCAK
jgi:hypothetical protein